MSCGSCTLKVFQSVKVLHVEGFLHTGGGTRRLGDLMSGMFAAAAYCAEICYRGITERSKRFTFVRHFVTERGRVGRRVDNTAANIYQ
jgi:hypothetical protein